MITTIMVKIFSGILAYDKSEDQVNDISRRCLRERSHTTQFLANIYMYSMHGIYKSTRNTFYLRQIEIKFGHLLWPKRRRETLTFRIFIWACRLSVWCPSWIIACWSYFWIWRTWDTRSGSLMDCIRFIRRRCLRSRVIETCCSLVGNNIGRRITEHSQCMVYIKADKSKLNSVTCISWPERKREALTPISRSAGGIHFCRRGYLLSSILRHGCSVVFHFSFLVL